MWPSARALLRLKHAAENFQQRGFARAVRADEHDALAAFGLEIDNGRDKRHVARRKPVDVFQRDDLVTAALRLRKGEADLAVVARRRFDFVHALDLLELALRLRRLGGLGAETVGELLQPISRC